jgi:hypothetical protein
MQKEMRYFPLFFFQNGNLAGSGGWAKPVIHQEAERQEGRLPGLRPAWATGQDLVKKINT